MLNNLQKRSPFLTTVYIYLLSCIRFGRVASLIEASFEKPIGFQENLFLFTFFRKCVLRLGSIILLFYFCWSHKLSVAFCDEFEKKIENQFIYFLTLKSNMMYLVTARVPLARFEPSLVE